MKIKKRPELSIAFPIWNEEAGIERTITSLTKVFDKHKVNYEFVLVYQKSKDNTLKILERLVKKNKKLKLFKLPVNGYVLAVNYGMEHSNGDYIGYSNSDGEVDAEDTYRIYKILNEGNYDAAKACRIKRRQGIYRTITTKVFNFLIKIRFNFGIKDINGWPFFFKRGLYEKIKTNEKGEMYDLDMKGKLVGNGYSLAEVEVLHRKREGGTSCMNIGKVAYMQYEWINFFLKNRHWNKKSKVDYYSFDNRKIN